MDRRSLAVVALAVACRGHSRPAPLPTLDCQNLFAVGGSASRLASAFGAGNLATGEVPLGDTEGDMLPATILFPRDRARRIAVVWQDTIRKQGTRYVYLTRASSAWRTPEGISIGTSLRELERLNGKPFTMAGFAFDQAGAVISWNDGRLEPYKTGPCLVNFGLDSIAATGDSVRVWMRRVRGDGEFSSQHPSMQALNPRVSRMLLFHP